MTYHNGDLYEGQWQYGLRHGHVLFAVVAKGVEEKNNAKLKKGEISMGEYGTFV